MLLGKDDDPTHVSTDLPTRRPQHRTGDAEYDECDQDREAQGRVTQRRHSPQVFGSSPSNRSFCSRMGKPPHLFFVLVALVALSIASLMLQSSRLSASLSMREMYWLRINTVFAHDFLINIGVLSVPSTPTHYSSNGFTAMSKTNVTFLGVARNVEHQLQHVLHEVEKLSAHFAASQAIFVQGDSDDNTLLMLRQWASSSPHNRSILTTSKVGLRDEVNVGKDMLMPREGAIASARNVGLEYMASRSSTEYVIVLDMDLLGVSVTGVADSFGRTDQWDAVCAHGVILHGLYRDTYAFRTSELNTNHHWGDEQNRGASVVERARLKRQCHAAKLGVHSITDGMALKTLGEELAVVTSCFGGLTIYKRSHFDGCSYRYRYAAPPLMLDCEHVLLHQCMADRHGTRIRSNPTMYVPLSFTCLYISCNDVCRKLWYGAHSLNVKYRDVFGK